MKFRNLAVVAAAATMAAAPVIAAERTVAPVEGEAELGGRGSGVILAILAVAAIIGAIVIAVGDDNDDAVSP